MKHSRQISQVFLRSILAFMLLGMTGRHWTILQPLAWAKMIVTYSRTAPLPTALKQTFDGKHPCKMCKMIQRAAQPSHQKELQPPTEKDDVAFVEVHAVAFMNPPCFAIISSVDGACLSRSDPPPVPPPRFFIAKT